MHALVYHGPDDKRWEQVPDPKIIDDTDAIVRVDTATICGTDLHILHGDVPEVEPGRVLGHEAVGTVVETGVAVRAVRPGDHVLMSCISACGACTFCRRGRYGQCRGGGGWLLGHLVDGVQADYVRVPFADTSTYKVPEGVPDEYVLYLADILPTGYEVGVLNGRVSPADTVVVVGAGPIGLATVIGASLFSPREIVVVEPSDGRREWAVRFGAQRAVSPTEARSAVSDLTKGVGADVAIEAVGVPETFDLCTELVRPGGRVANVGVHGRPALLHLETLWIRDVTITTGLVDTFSIPTLLALIEVGRIDPVRFTTHRFRLADALDAHDTFARAAETNAIKVALVA
ncbi:MAG TPA: alcohol dehydrogenase catalytic domain-containing protein [Acidimicrobiia bacterium]|jgi:alcohol dehydrogenase